MLQNMRSADIGVLVIDRIARDQAAVLLRRFASDRITSDQFVDEFPVSTTDPTLRAIYGRAWALYDDLKTHFLGATPPLRRELARWIAFLHSDEEYRWPRYQFIQMRLPKLLNWMTGGWFNRRQDERFEDFARTGEFAVWPFFDSHAYERAIARPRYLRAQRSHA